MKIDVCKSRAEQRRECRHLDSVCDVIDTDCLQDQLAAKVTHQQIICTCKMDSGSLPYNLDRAQELCESGGDRPGLPVLNKPDSFCGLKAKVEVAVLVFPSLISLIVSVDVK